MEHVWALVPNVNFDEMEELFSANEIVKAVIGTLMLYIDAHMLLEKGGPKKIANIIDPKKSQNLGIILSTLKHPLVVVVA